VIRWRVLSAFSFITAETPSESGAVGLYLDYLINREHENGSLNNIDLLDQKTAP